MLVRPWRAQARPEQLPPTGGDWRTYLIQAGRGWGKTRACAEWLVEQAASCPGSKWAVVAAAPPEVRKVCLDGYSGVLKCLLPGEFESYSADDFRVRLTNGSTIQGFPAWRLDDEFRGHEFAGAWVDDADAFRYRIDDVWAAVTRSVSGRVVVTATPPMGGWPWLDDLAARDDTIRVVGSTWANAPNLSAATLAELRGRYAGTAVVEGR